MLPFALWNQLVSPCLRFTCDKLSIHNYLLSLFCTIGLNFFSMHFYAHSCAYLFFIVTLAQHSLADYISVEEMQSYARMRRMKRLHLSYHSHYQHSEYILSEYDEWRRFILWPFICRLCRDLSHVQNDFWFSLQKILSIHNTKTSKEMETRQNKTRIKNIRIKLIRSANDEKNMKWCKT